MHKDRVVGISLILALGFCATAVPAFGGTKLLVANDGTDGPECGTKTTPCRTISAAIAAANDGDTILVGPGRYGDMDGNGLFTRSDEEQGGNTGCVILVSKPLTILSTGGAAATVVDAGGASKSVFCLEVGGSVLGKRKKGFTITGAGSTSAGVIATSFGQPGRTIAGNRVTRNAFGIGAFGLDVVRGNDVVGNAITGIQISGPVVAEGNIVSGNGVDGMTCFGSGGLIRNNAVTANGQDGIQTNCTARIERTVVSGNAGNGIFAAQSTLTIVDTAVLGNTLAGVRILDGADVTISKSNIFANGPESGVSINCGVLNLGLPVSVTETYWGAASGPGPNPADSVCVAMSGGPVTVTPFATKARKITPRIQPPE